MIRKIEIGDIQFINKLGSEYQDNFENYYNINNYIDNDVYFCYLYQINGKILGFILFTNLYETCEIELIYVDKMSRNKGIGTQLLKELEKNTSKILLEVSVDNISAYNLYLKNGYKVINKRKNYYKTTDAYVMEKII